MSSPWSYLSERIEMFGAYERCDGHVVMHADERTGDEALESELDSAVAEHIEGYNVVENEDGDLVLERA